MEVNFMNIKELLNKIFSAKSKAIVLPNDLVYIPKREGLSKDNLVKLDNFKAEYKKILSQKKFFSSYDLTSEYFNDEMLMNFTLFGILIINHDDGFNYDTLSFDDKVDIWIHRNVNPRKIKIYIDRMEEIYANTYLRLIALKEIYDEVLELNLFRNRKNAIMNEIYNLTTNYVIFKSNIYSASVEVKTYINELKNSYLNTTDGLKKGLINEYYEKVLGYALEFVPDEVNKILEMNLNVLDGIAYIERELEIYAYKKLNVDELNRELEEIDKIEKRAINRKELIDKISKLEKKYIILNDYGRYKLNLKPLYDIKFDILTINMENIKENPFKEIPEGREFNFYKDIIAEKIETNIIGADSLLSQCLPDDDQFIIKTIVAILKGYGSDHYDYNEIVRDRFLLNLVLNVTSLYKADSFFKNYMVTKDDTILSQIYFDNHFDKSFSLPWQDGIALKVICNLLSLLDNSYYYNYKELYDYFTERYNSLYIYDIIDVPEGINQISIDFSNEDLKYSDEILKRISGAWVVMPKSLRTLKIDNLACECYNSIDKIVLNEGLERLEICEDTDKCHTVYETDGTSRILGSKSVSEEPASKFYVNRFFRELKTRSLTIPSTLECIDLVEYNTDFDESYNIENIDLTKVPELIFTNCISSKMLNNDRIRRKIFEDKVSAAVEDGKFSYDSENGAIIPKYQNYNKINRVVLLSATETQVTISMDKVVCKVYTSLVYSYVVNNSLNFINNGKLTDSFAEAIKKAAVLECERRYEEAFRTYKKIKKK